MPECAKVSKLSSVLNLPPIDKVAQTLSKEVALRFEIDGRILPSIAPKSLDIS